MHLQEEEKRLTWRGTHLSQESGISHSTAECPDRDHNSLVMLLADASPTEGPKACLHIYFTPEEKKRNFMFCTCEVAGRGRAVQGHLQLYTEFSDILG